MYKVVNFIIRSVLLKIQVLSESNKQFYKMKKSKEFQFSFENNDFY